MSDSGHTQVRNARLAWWSDGESTDGRDPLVLVHAGVADARMWEPIVPALAAQRRVVRFDMRGFGRSRSAKGGFSPANDLAALLDDLSIERAHAVGASFGGLVSLEFAAAYPDRVASLVLLAAALPDIEPSPSLMAFAEAEEAAIAVGKIDEAVEVNVKMWASHSTPEVQALVADMQRVAFELQLREGAESDEPDPPVSARLAEITVPVTVAYADRDVEDFADIARRLHAELPDATLHEIADAGHLVALDQPAAVTQVILRHLENVTARTPASPPR